MFAFISSPAIITQLLIITIAVFTFLTSGLYLVNRALNPSGSSVQTKSPQVRYAKQEPSTSNAA